MSRNRVFYGWWVLSGIFMSYTALVGIQVYALPLFFPELKAEFGWSKPSIAYTATLFYLTGASITPFVSSLFDRYSARLFMVAGGLLTVAGLFAYRSMETLTHLTIIYVVLALSQVCAGQVPTMLIVTRWFKRYRGIAIGITLTGTSVGGAVFPIVFRQVLAVGEWRDVIFVYIIISAVLMLLPMILLIRSRPEDKGLLPDGDSTKTETTDRPLQPETHAGLTLREALRNPAFYILAFTTGALWFTMNGVYNNQSFFLSEELGFGASSYSLISSAIFVFAIVGKLLFGYLSDRFDKILIMVIVVIMLVVGLAFLRMANAENILILYGYASVFGLGFGGTFTMIQLVIAEFFAGRSYGKILGILTAVDVACAGISISAVAVMSEYYGSYFPVIDKLIGLTCVVAILVFLLLRIRRRQLQKSAPVPAANV